MIIRSFPGALALVVFAARLALSAPAACQTPGGTRGTLDVTPGTESAAHSDGAFYALLIGNARYRSIPSLQTPRSVAIALEHVLADQYGFQTNLLLDASRNQILDALAAYRRSLHESDSLLIFYAGHGNRDPVADEAYWLPVDAEQDRDSNWISMGDIASRIRSLAARHVLVISDSCYSGSMLLRGDPNIEVPTEAVHRFAMLSRLSSRDWMASGSLEPVEDGGAPGHSIFAAALLQGLEQMPGSEFSADDLFHAYVRTRVAGNSLQMPQYGLIRNSGDQLGDFIFLRLPTAGSASAAPASTAPLAAADPANSLTEALGRMLSASCRPTAPLDESDKPTGGVELCQYQHHRGLVPDDRYVACLRDGVNQGNSRAQVLLGHLLMNGQAGVSQDYQQAMSLFQKAADHGDVKGMLALAGAYDLRARNDTHSELLSFVNHRKAAETGDPEAMALFADTLSEKCGGEGSNCPDALPWYRKAADAGSISAMDELANCYEQGSCGLPKDIAQAGAWYLKAADHGDWPAMLWLSRKYESGSDGFPVDHAKAQEFQRRAAEKQCDELHSQALQLKP